MDYVFQPYPKMLYRGRTLTNGSLDVEQKIVGSEAEENLAKAEGWFDHPQTATDAEKRAHRDQQDQERQAEDRHQAELIEQAISKVLDRRQEALETRSEVGQGPGTGETKPVENPSIPVDQSPPLTRKEAAKALRVSLDTLDRLRNDGVVKMFQVGSRWFMLRSEVHRVRQLPKFRDR